MEFVRHPFLQPTEIIGANVSRPPSGYRGITPAPDWSALFAQAGAVLAALETPIALRPAVVNPTVNDPERADRQRRYARKHSMLFANPAIPPKRPGRPRVRRRRRSSETPAPIVPWTPRHPYRFIRKPGEKI